LKVIIVGAGTGGLCLAQGLKSSGISVKVYERERTPTDRLLGYRLSINAQGSRALKSCLPEALFAKFVRGAANPSQSVTFLERPISASAGRIVFYPQTVTELMDAVARESLNVDQFFMMHIGPTPWSELTKAIAVAEKQDTPSGILE
jgi:2-polyprenyl-6-methoxyphenol hydroxylase-like FAD-dependent oxidoreductase